ncbi:Ribonuclease Z [archaeon HR01]|nr:Ribonuclease Z [archaeon HR01]
MKLLILGAGSIVPTPKRFASGVLAEFSGERILIDPGPGTIERLRSLNITPHMIDRVLVTHFHLDHFSDLLPFVMSRAFNEYGMPDSSPKNLDVVGPRGMESLFRRLVAGVEELSYLSKVMKCLEYTQVTDIDDGDTLPGKIRVKAASVEHFNGVAFRLEGEGMSITYSGDTVPDERLVSLARGVDILIHECSFPHGLLVGKHTSEKQLAEIAAKVNPRLLVVTHLYPVWEGREEEIVRAVESVGVRAVVARDMMQVI